MTVEPGELVLSPINDPVQNSLSHKLLQFHIKQKLILHDEVALAIANARAVLVNNIYSFKL